MQTNKIPCLLAILTCLITSACKCPRSKDASLSKSDTTIYAYPIKYPGRWVIDTGHVNTAVALKALKAFEKNDTAEMKAYFADTLIAGFDGSSFKGPRCQFLAMVKNERDGLKKVTNRLYDCQAVTSKDKTEGWITTWLLQVTTDMRDKTDSIEYVYDSQFKNGKIIMWNKYARHLKKID